MEEKYEKVFVINDIFNISYNYEDIVNIMKRIVEYYGQIYNLYV